MSKTVLIFNEDSEWMCDRLPEMCPGYTFRFATSEAEAIAKGADAEILMGLAPYISAEMVRAMPRLEWIHALTTGYDNLLTMRDLPAHVAISNSRGFHGPQMAELAILSMMVLARDYRRTLDNQAMAVWERRPQPLLLNKTVCIVGLGAIAEALTARCTPFGLRVTGVSDGRTSLPGMDRIYARDDIEAAAAEADFLVALVPYSQRTHHIIGEDVFRAMRPSAYLVNLSRGGCIDEGALLRNLDAGALAGAALDVFETEPLPSGNPLWSHPKVIVTPHIGGMSDIYHEQVLPLVADNLNRYAAQGSDGLRSRVERTAKEAAQ